MLKSARVSVKTVRVALLIVVGVGWQVALAVILQIGWLNNLPNEVVIVLCLVPVAALIVWLVIHEKTRKHVYTHPIMSFALFILIGGCVGVLVSAFIWWALYVPHGQLTQGTQAAPSISEGSPASPVSPASSSSTVSPISATSPSLQPSLIATPSPEEAKRANINASIKAVCLELVPDRDFGGFIDSYITLRLSLLNEGEDTNIREFRLKLEMDSRFYDAEIQSLENLELERWVYYKRGQSMAVRDPLLDLNLTKSDLLKRGIYREGWLRFVARRSTEPPYKKARHAAIKLTIIDGFGGSPGFDANAPRDCPGDIKTKGSALPPPRSSLIK